MRSSHLVPALTAVVVAGALAACSLFVSTDGLSSGESDAAVSTSDASIDAPSDHVSPPFDAGSDANADATTTPFCASNPGHSLCYDFDESPDLPAVDNTQFDTGHVFIDDKTSVSPAQSLAILFSPGPGANESIEKDLPQTKGGVLSFAFDVQYSASDLTTGQTITMTIDVPPSPGLANHFFYLQSYYGSLSLSETVAPNDGGASDFPSTGLASPVPNDTWMHVASTIDGNTRDWKIFVNGKMVADTKAEVGFPSGIAHVGLGGYGNQDVPVDTTEHLDNFVVDY